MVLEYHKDRAGIHMHALMSGALELVDSGTVSVPGHRPMKRSTARRLHIPEAEQHTVYNVGNWALGWSTAIAIYAQGPALAGYLTKYITKAPEKIAGRWYWSGGKGLVRSVPTVYGCADYTRAAGKEYAIPGANMRVKYAEYSLDGEE